MFYFLTHLIFYLLTIKILPVEVFLEYSMDKSEIKSIKYLSINLLQGLDCQLGVVSFFGRWQIDKLCEARVEPADVIPLITIHPSGLDLVHCPHLMYVLRKFVSDGLNERWQSHLARIKAIG